ncbi:MAG TPA: DNA-processing protein DprA [Tepidisphaeraceae bacterium]|nr:DNA-processing protein DprA [Tepidisphaeraceae bacterium]
MIRHWLQLAMTSGIGPILIRRLVDAAGGAEAACNASVALLREIEGIGAAKAAKIRQAMRESADGVDKELSAAAALGVTIIVQEDETFPLLLRSIPDPPAVLYVKGSFEPRDLNAVAIVGSRKCSYYGREQAERFGALLAGAGVTVLSGGARGVDSSAHRGALSHPQGRTVAVLGSGIDVPYPPENAGLFEQIAAKGALVSEYPLGSAPVKENFPRRNRIVSGISRGVLVIEADERSGALITARQACDDHGRTVFALPGRVDSPTSAGPHRLIRDGATLVTCLEDILEGLGPLPQEAHEESLFGASASAKPQAAEPERVAQTIDPILTDRQRVVLAQLDGQPVHIDTLIERTSLGANEILQDLTLLSLKGIVKRVDGQTFVRAAAGKTR